jgi:hypothetical protein
MAFPGSQVHFIYRVRLIEGVIILAVLHPLGIIPFVIEIPNYRCGIWWFFTVKARIGVFNNYSTVIRLYLVFISTPFSTLGMNPSQIPENPILLEVGVLLESKIKISYDRHRVGSWAQTAK